VTAFRCSLSMNVFLYITIFLSLLFLLKYIGGYFLNSSHTIRFSWTENDYSSGWYVYHKIKVFCVAT
jgi:hypothetical protein